MLRSSAKTTSILRLARSDESPDWQELDRACYHLGEAGRVQITEVSRPEIDPATGQRIRAVTACLTHPDYGRADVVFHVGVKDDSVFSGYKPTAFRDTYCVTLADGRVFTGRLWWPKYADGPMKKAWRLVSPLKMAVWWATYARLLDGRPLVE